MSFYVKRVRKSDGRIGWTGPIRSERQAEREAQAWRDATDSLDVQDWYATVHISDKFTRKLVRDWQRDVRLRFVQSA